MNGVPATRSTVPEATLEIADLQVRFGGVHAVNGVDLKVGPGEIVGLIGPNGAGKTTLIDAVTGFVKTAGGTVEINGEPVGHLAPHRRAERGISRSFQSLELFEDLTVYENLQMASDQRRPARLLTSLVWRHSEPLSPEAVAAVREFELEEDLDRLPSDLSFGRRRLVAVARAVAAQPSVLLLDEPAAGLGEHESKELAQLVRRLADTWGLAILLVEHDMDFVMAICDRLTALDFGHEIAHGSTAEVRSDPAVIAAYLGDPADEGAGGVKDPVTATDSSQ